MPEMEYNTKTLAATAAAGGGKAEAQNNFASAPTGDPHKFKSKWLLQEIGTTRPRLSKFKPSRTFETLCLSDPV